MADTTFWLGNKTSYGHQFGSAVFPAKTLSKHTVTTGSALGLWIIAETAKGTFTKYTDDAGVPVDGGGDPIDQKAWINAVQNAENSGVREAKYDALLLDYTALFVAAVAHGMTMTDYALPQTYNLPNFPLAQSDIVRS